MQKSQIIIPPTIKLSTVKLDSYGRALQGNMNSGNNIYTPLLKLEFFVV